MVIANALTPKFQIFQKMDLIALCSEWLIYKTKFQTSFFSGGNIQRKLLFFNKKLFCSGTRQDLKCIRE